MKLHHHLLRFDDERHAITVLSPLTIPIKVFNHTFMSPLIARDGWDARRVTPNQKIILERAEYDDAGNTVSPEQLLPGWYLTVSLLAIDPRLRDLPNHLCRLITVENTGEILWMAADMGAELLTTAFIDPLPNIPLMH